jgi:hypothetical protein
MKDNPNAIPGTAAGAKSISEMRRSNDIELPSEGINVVISNKFRSANIDFKYAVDGLISSVGELGRHIFTNSSTKRNIGNLIVDANKSIFTSTGKKTTLGSTVIQTLSGRITNPLGNFFPSSALTPTKTWISSFFPILGDSEYSQLFIFGTIQALLFSLLKSLEPKSKESIINDTSTKDIGTIIIDNQEIKNKILQDSL